jgi:glucose/arabinose dehydrogenase
MNRLTWRVIPIVLAIVAVLALGVSNGLLAQQEVPMRGNTPVAPQGIKIPPLPDAPVRYETAEGQNIRVGVYARGFQNPWSMAFVSDDTILVAERGGAIKAVRNGVVDPQPVRGMPRAIGAGLSGTDLALHPDFARNRLVYISYTKPIEEERRQGVPGDGAQPGAASAPAPAPAGRGGRGAGPRTTVAVARAVWDGKGFTDAKDIFVGDGGSGGPIVFGGDGMLYVAHGGGDTQSPKTLAGKILRLTDEGKVPPDNPFVGRADARPEIFTMGHRTFLRMAKHPLTGAIWQIENGPNGGDEVNILTPGTNYGWPLISLGRTYAGPWQGPFSKEGFRDPIIYWMPAIAVSSITFYTGDRLPKWKGDVFVSGMRYGEIPGTGQLHRILINKNLEELRREPLLVDLRRRIRDVKQGRDGLLYLLTDEADAVMLRIEPAD